MENQKLLDWVVEKIRTEYKDDVSLLVGYDLDEPEQGGGPYQYYKAPFDFFVPETERGNELAQTFIVDGIGYDLYPRGWEWINAMAEGDDYHFGALGEGKILYSRSPQDTCRFEAARAKLRQNLANPEFCYAKALGQLDVAMGVYASLQFTQALGEARMQAGYVADYAARAIAFLNRRYFVQAHVNQLAELAQMEKVPEGFAGLYTGIMHAKSAEELRQNCHAMLALVREMLEQNRPAQRADTPDFAGLAGWYEELSFTWRRIYRQCNAGNAQRAFMWAVMLQNELAIVAQEYGLDKMDLLGVYDAGDLKPLQQRAAELEDHIRSEISAHGAVIEEYPGMDAFLARN